MKFENKMNEVCKQNLELFDLKQTFVCSLLMLELPSLFYVSCSTIKTDINFFAASKRLQKGTRVRRE